MPDQRDGQQAARRETTGSEQARQAMRDESANDAAAEPGEARGNEQVLQGKKNVSVEPPPELAEHGGIEPQERDPSEYHDRTRDRELDEG